MNRLSAFLARVKANKVTSSMAVAFLIAAIVLAFPAWFKWLPPEAFAALWDGATKVFTFGIAFVVLFMKQHSTVGDPAKPDAGTFTEAKETKLDETSTDWRENASGREAR